MIAFPSDESSKKSLHNKDGKRSKQINPKSLANLQMWSKGQSGNPKGRPSAGAAIIEWFNQFQKMSEPEVKAISDDQAESIAKRVAARQWLDALTSGTAADRILDRTVGRPAQSVDVTSQGEHINAAKPALAKMLGKPGAFQGAKRLQELMADSEG